MESVYSVMERMNCHHRICNTTRQTGSLQLRTYVLLISLARYLKKAFLCIGILKNRYWNDQPCSSQILFLMAYTGCTDTGNIAAIIALATVLFRTKHVKNYYLCYFFPVV